MKIKEPIQEYKIKNFVFSPLVKIFKKRKYICLYHPLTLKRIYIPIKVWKKCCQVRKSPSPNCREFFSILEKLGFVYPSNSLISVEKQVNDIRESIALKSPQPYVWYVLLTTDCNLSCDYCLYKLETNPKYLHRTEFDKFTEIIQRIGDADKTQEVLFYGGEPLLNKNLLRYAVQKLRSITQFQWKFLLSTNGTLIDKSIARFLKEYNFGVSLSLDGTRELHNYYRKFKDGRGSYDAAIRGLRLLLKNGVSVSIACTITPKNIDKLPSLVKFFKALGVKSIGFNYPLGQAIDSKKIAKNLFLAYEESIKCGLGEERIGNRFARFFIEEIQKWADCAACGKMIALIPGGKVSPCHSFHCLGKETVSLEALLDGRDYELFNEWAKLSPWNDSFCWRCEAISICGGGCYLNRYLKNKDKRKRDLNWCRFVREILRKLIEKEVLSLQQN